jgi:hypothetical protein
MKGMPTKITVEFEGYDEDENQVLEFAGTETEVSLNFRREGDEVISDFRTVETESNKED